ncbi:protoporphyrinogen oxidase-like [Watersipora subatra]|uniref:protoporphyrinogen oxidase-like n=1 Tax=Watersipora subatra TaxID=2589382 RepID=UPI00355C63A9
MSSQRRIVVLGGGVSGLSFSYYLNLYKNGVLRAKNALLPQITVIEKGDTLGGWMKSYRDPSTGAVFSKGPRSLRGVGYEAQSSLSLVEDLGLSDEVIAVTRRQPAGKKRLIYSGGQLHQLPTEFLGFFQKLPFLGRSLAGIAYTETRTPSCPEKKGQDESIHSFVSRRFGIDVADKLADPFLRGIIAGDVRETSIQTMAPRFKTVEDNYGSLLWNIRKVPEQVVGRVKNSVLCRRALDEKWAMWNLQSGLGALPTALHKKLLEQGADVRTGCACTQLEWKDDRFLVHTEEGVVEADVVVAALNAKRLADLLPESCESLSSKLSALPIAHVATATLEYPESETRHVMQAFGHLIPSGEGEDILGVIYNSEIFPEHDREDKSTKRFTAMIGGAWFDEVLGSNPTTTDVEEIAMKSLARQLDIAAPPVNIVTDILWDAIPQYPVGHPNTMLSIDKEITDSGLPLSLIGPSYDSPGAHSCIHRAKVQAMNLLTQWNDIDSKASSASQ